MLADAAAGPPRATLAYLAGDSYPLDARIEGAVRHAFAGAALRWIGQREGLAGERFTSEPQHRLAALARAVGDTPRERLWLLGRSSGIRLATRHAVDHPVAGVIGFGYPFEAPGVGPEPERVAHLARLRVPTLIVQGERDRYGGRALAGRLDLSPSIEFLWVDADHELRLAPAGWLAVLAQVRAFAARHGLALRTAQEAAG
ncbi:alpha/beta family hydrolase [Piscinibacter sakaiensis]|nr:alpha/beta family hydrolase [Piscinibacter sakaiensis]